MDSLKHLPQNKRNDLERVVEIIRHGCASAELIILFGSYARGDWKEAKELEPDRWSGHASDYDILAVTKSEEDCGSAWQEIDSACIEASLSAYPRIIHHGITYLNRKLELGQYFFTDIIGEGKVLYDSGAFTLAKQRALTPAERLEIARDDYDYWFKSAQDFYSIFGFTHSRGLLTKAAFSLHQTAESCYKTALLVFTGYVPDEHYLSILSQLAGKIDRRFVDAFAATNEFEREAFTALDNAYVGGRYQKTYSIDEPTLIYLAGRVETLLQLTKQQCEEKIAALEQAVRGRQT